MSAGSSLLRKRKNEKTASSRRTVADGLMSATGPLLTLAIGPEAVRSALPGREDGSRGSTSGTSTFKPETPARRTGWLVLKEVLKTVGDGSDLFLPLKAAVVGVVALMDAMDNVEDARSGFSEIARKIEGFQVILSRYNSEQDIPPDIRRRLDRFVTELGSIEKVIKTKTERGAARRAIEALGDIQDIENVFRALATMAEEFKLECNLNIEQKVEDIAAEDMLAKLRHIPDAGIDAQYGDACMKGTRVGLLQDLDAWRNDPDATRLFWVDGMAGTGKSAITRSFCHILSRDKSLGGSFFCSRGTVRDDVKRIIPTLASSLARQHAGYKLALLDVLREYPNAAHDRLGLQVERLLETPLRVAFGANSPMLVLVIDALDECSDDKATSLMLTELISKSPRIPVKFFVTSRPEQHIRAQFENRQSGLRRVLRLHDVERDLVKADISHYLTHRFREIRNQRNNSDPSYIFPPEWPNRRDVDAVTRHAGTLFIYAFTAVEYVKKDPIPRLRKLAGFAVTAGQPLTKTLDGMYSFVLERATDPAERDEEEISMMKRILADILAIREPLCLSALSSLIGIHAQELRSALEPLHAVVRIPPENDSGVVSTFHASFGDYLTNRERAKDFFLSPSDGHCDLARASIDVMASEALHFNVSGCQTSYLPNSAQNLATIPAHLIYSCLYWPYHLVLTVTDTSLLLRLLDETFRPKFLFWIEVLSAIGKVSLASSLIMRVLTAHGMRDSLTQSLAKFLNDANEFVVSCREAIERSVPHIYLSALPSLHMNSKIRKELWSKFTNIPVLNVQGIQRRRETILHIRGHTGGVRFVTFSPDGSRIVSCSYDKTIRVWDANTGEELVKPLEGHTEAVGSVAFSRDGSRIVSCSFDKTIRVWDANTGEELVKPLEGHTSVVMSVAFSPDGSRIVSCSGDKTIRVWDANTGEELVKPLEGHTHRVMSVAFSPDGSRIVSCSDDKTIRVWDANTGEELVKPLEGHTDGVTSIAFSPDGSRIVSCSGDKTIRVWDAKTGNANMKSHTAAFSPYQSRMSPIVRLPKQGLSVVTPSGIFTRSAQSPGQCQSLSQQSYDLSPDHSFEPHSLYEGSGIDDPRDIFTVDSDSGWIRGPRGELVLWVPDECRSTLYRPRNTLIIGRSRVIYDMNRFVHGADWTKCYTP